MQYVKVVLGLPVEGPFDYIVPDKYYKKIKAGARVWVPFGTRKMLGYVVKITTSTSIKRLKAIYDLLDSYPILDKNMLLLAKELSDYYCCSWGEAIETALPEALRKGKLLPNSEGFNPQEGRLKSNTVGNKETILLHGLDAIGRWERYIPEIKSYLAEKKTVIILFPDIDSVIEAREIIRERIGCALATLYRKEPQEDLEEWIKVRERAVPIAIGTRAAIFAPFKNLGLVIVDGEESSIYKQDQVPHYHAREVAILRTKREKARLILGSSSPSLEAMNLRKEYVFIPQQKAFPEIKIMDMSHFPYSMKGKKTIFSKYLEDAIAASLSLNGKVLLFLNRRGFATLASCSSCRIILKCPRCSVNLAYHFKDNVLKCHYCNFKISPPRICPVCNSGYIKYYGLGTEKIESELARIFPSAKIRLLNSTDKAAISEADIFISTESIIGCTGLNFDLIGILSIDNSLNRIDFRSCEKVFSLLVKLIRLSNTKVVIQTRLPNHHVFQALTHKEDKLFYDEELRQRRELGFPPCRHLCLVKLRGKEEFRVKEASHRLFEWLNKQNKGKGIRIISFNPRIPLKLRGNYYWQILMSSHNAKKMSKFLKMHLRDFKHSGIIMTVDMDPL